jgi:GrpB-like predicted nucleotidyltransferase (UPF0157 family)
MSDVFADDAAVAFAQHALRIHERLPDVEVRHTGGTSIPGVLTTGDVDLQVRVEKGAFEVAREILCQLYEPHHADAWHSEGAFFTAPGSQPPVEVALTAIGGLDDLHHGEAWHRIAADQELVERYNALKREHDGGPVDDYLAAKRDFFYRNFRLSPTPSRETARLVPRSARSRRADRQSAP